MDRPSPAADSGASWHHLAAAETAPTGVLGDAMLSAMPTSPLVAVVCGSRSDLATLRGCFDVLDSYEIGWEASVISAHRQPDALHAYVGEAEDRGIRLFIGAAGLAAHLPGVLASLTARPVIGVPMDGGALGGADALYSIVQMPPGVPVASVAIGSPGAKNAAHLAARILALADSELAARVDAFRADQAGRAEIDIDPRK
jgi:5-(carboxyamino)imidazole ribonucleotide mutase